MSTPLHTVPRHLSTQSREWLRHLRNDYEWTPTEWSLAVFAAESRDRAGSARRKLAREGVTLAAPILSRAGEVVGDRVTAHPAAAIARDATSLYARLVSQLGLDTQGDPS